DDLFGEPRAVLRRLRRVVGGRPLRRGLAGVGEQKDDQGVPRNSHGALTYYNHRRVKCPGCGTAVDDGASICPKCDYIIDSSFLEGAAEAGSAAPARAAPPPARPRPS